VKEGIYFSEKEMKQRNPLLYQQLIGQYLTKQEVEDRNNADRTDIKYVLLAVVMNFNTRCMIFMYEIVLKLKTSILNHLHPNRLAQVTHQPKCPLPHRPLLTSSIPGIQIWPYQFPVQKVCTPNHTSQPCRCHLMRNCVPSLILVPEGDLAHQP
jgi:hypothetical protein